MAVINIDRITCDGRGMCAELLPELIELDDWGYPIVWAAEVPAPLIEHARRAVAACPVLAFRLYEDPTLAARVTPVPGVGAAISRVESTSARRTESFSG